MDKSHRLDISLSAEDYEALGALTVHYSHTELLSAIGVWSLLKINPREGSLITSKLALKQRFELLSELASANGIPQAAVTAIDGIAKEFDKKDGLTAKRNSLIHAVWSTNEKNEKAIPVAFPRSGGAKTGPETTAELIEQVTKDVCVQGKRLQELISSLGLFPDKISFSRPLPG